MRISKLIFILILLSHSLVNSQNLCELQEKKAVYVFKQDRIKRSRFYELKWNSHNFIIVLLGDSENWKEMGFELSVFFVSQIDNKRFPNRIANHQHNLPIVEFVQNATIERLSKDIIRTVTVSHTCSDIIIDNQTACNSETLKMTYNLANDKFEILDSAYISYEYKI